MSARFWYSSVLAVAVLCGAVGTIHAQSAAQEAAKRNQEGKELWLKEKNLEAAVEKFREATTLSPEPKYYFNLCYALHQLGRFPEARTACQAVLANGSNEKLNKKARLVLDDIAKRLPPEPPSGGDGDGDGAGGDGDGDGAGGDGDGDGAGGDGDGDGDGDGAGGDGDGDGAGGDGDGDGATGTGTGTGAGTGTGNGGGTGTGTGAGAGAGTGTGGATSPPPGPIPGLYQPAELPDDYKWALGVELGFAGTTIGKQKFGSGGGLARIYLDLAGLRSQRAGVQIFASALPMQGEDESLVVTNLGGAVYKHFGVRNFYVTPLVGAYFAVMRSTSFVDPDKTLVALGARFEGSATWLFGAKRQHAVKGILGFDYTLGTDNDFGDGFDANLDRPGATVSLMVGYALRFTTPFGRNSLLTFE